MDSSRYPSLGPVPSEACLEAKLSVDLALSYAGNKHITHVERIHVVSDFLGIKSSVPILGPAMSTLL